MPQDSLRSAVYRSFVTCDDPNGVVECGTIRKSKSNPKKLEDEVKIRRTTKNSNSSTSSTCTSKEEGKEMDSRTITAKDSRNPSAFQLMEVSREAQKLTNVIDTWSNGRAFDGHSKEIAKDLLKGALDLQESLVMLGKLQEASQYMAKLKKKQKEKSRGDISHEQKLQRTNSDRFGDREYEVGFQKPRVSVDGASRDCFDELRTAIRDSLARQNLLPPGSDDEKAFLRDKRTIDSITDVASTSSSQKSMVQFRNFDSSDGSVSSKSPLKSKGSNLIAKLMGLEDIPSKVVSIPPRKQLDFDKFEVDMPMKMKPRSVTNQVDAEQMKLDKIVENMKSKGVLTRNFGEGFQLQSHRSIASNYRKRYTEYDPPIVVIKPIRFSSTKAIEPHPQTFARDVKMGKHHQQAMYQRDGAMNSSRLKICEAKAERPRQKGDRICNEVRAKPEDMVVKKSSVKLKSSLPVNQQQRRKTVDEKKGDAMHKVKSMRKRPQDQPKPNSIEERKLKMGSKITKNRTSIHNNSSSDPVAEETAISVTRSFGDRRKNMNNEKSIKEGLRDNVFVADSSGLNEPDMMRTSAGTTDELLTEEGTVDSDVQIKGLDQMNDFQNSVSNVPLEETQHETFITGGGEDSISRGYYTTDNTHTRTRTEVEDLLWSNASFISHAEMLFDVSSNQAIVQQTSIITDIKKADLSLLLDCANDLVLHKRLRCEQATHPLLLKRSTSISISLEHLVEEVCNEIEKLKSYSENASEKLRLDGLYTVLERDLASVAGPSGTWDLGWRHGFTVDEVELVVDEVEKLVFSGLMEEIFADYVL